MTKPLVDSVSEMTSIANHGVANKENLKARWAQAEAEIGKKFKTDIGGLMDDLSSWAAWLADKATDASADHGAVKLDVGEQGAFMTETVKKAHVRASRCRGAIHNCYGAAVSQRTFGRGKTPETAADLSVFLKRAVLQMTDPKLTWTVLDDDVFVDPKKMAPKLDALRVEMQTEAGTLNVQKGDVKVKQVQRDTIGTKVRNGRTGTKEIVGGFLRLLGDTEGASHITMHRHKSPTLGTPETPPVPPPVVDEGEE